MLTPIRPIRVVLPPEFYNAAVGWRTPWAGCSEFRPRPAFDQDDVLGCFYAGEIKAEPFSEAWSLDDLDYWSPRDHCMRVAYFCGGKVDPIKLDLWPDSQIDVIDGNHRALSRLAMGRKVPAIVRPMFPEDMPMHVFAPFASFQRSWFS